MLHEKHNFFFFWEKNQLRNNSNFFARYEYTKVLCGHHLKNYLIRNKIALSAKVQEDWDEESQQEFRGKKECKNHNIYYSKFI